jgi:formylmethanofuran dehydrogenase subunit A
MHFRHDRTFSGYTSNVWRDNSSNIPAVCQLLGEKDNLIVLVGYRLGKPSNVPVRFSTVWIRRMV